ncbi:MAG: type II toxin-antitoxin system RelE/ParE family toxin [Planctomycetota bacterium]
MSNVRWTPIAQSDLDDLLYYIAVEDGRPETAIKILDELLETLDKRFSNQVPGQTHDAAPADWSYFRFKRWLIFYQESQAHIEIMRVVDGVRDLPRTL